ncbi:MAG: DUF6262 family protein [Pedobacter sp.]
MYEVPESINPEYRKIKRGDKNAMKEVTCGNNSEVAIIQYLWWLDYVEELKSSGQRFPAARNTGSANIAAIAGAVGVDRGRLYKNRYIKCRIDDDIAEVGCEVVKADSDIKNSDAEKDATISAYQETIYRLTQEKETLEAELESCKRKLKARYRSEKTALDHLFETGRRTIL